jgi:hypothetical protein
MNYEFAYTPRKERCKLKIIYTVGCVILFHIGNVGMSIIDSI